MTIKALTFKTANTPEQLKKTIRLIGNAIKAGSIYIPLRHLAARTATAAPPKNYHAMIAILYDAIVKRWWHYVYDPPGAEMLVLDGPRIFDLVLNKGKAGNRGYGDCDDITVASGALLRSIGMDVRICTTAPPKSPYIFNHVFLQVKPPRERKWTTFDPVVYPHHGLGYMVPNDRFAAWDLDGNMLFKRGKFPPKFDETMAMYGFDGDGIATTTAAIGDDASMQTNNIFSNRRPTWHDFEDYSFSGGFLGANDVIDENDPLDMQRAHRELADFSVHGMLGFGCYADMMGCMTGEQLPYIMAEYDKYDEIGDTGLVRTKHFEMSPDDYDHARRMGVPKIGALALADDGDIYEWQEPNDNYQFGFFKKIVRAAKKGARKLKKKAKKLFMKTKFGRGLWKVGGKVFKTAGKIAKGFMRVVGPIATKIAPIAAMIPGVGPFIAAGLVATGAAYKIAKQMGISFDKKGRPQPKNKAQAKAYAKKLASAGRKMGKKKAKGIVHALKQKHEKRPEVKKAKARALAAKRKAIDAKARIQRAKSQAKKAAERQLKSRLASEKKAMAQLRRQLLQEQKKAAAQNAAAITEMRKMSRLIRAMQQQKPPTITPLSPTGPSSPGRLPQPPIVATARRFAPSARRRPTSYMGYADVLDVSYQRMPMDDAVGWF